MGGIKLYDIGPQEIIGGISHNLRVVIVGCHNQRRKLAIDDPRADDYSLVPAGVKSSGENIS